MLAGELLNKPDGFLFARNGEEEYVVTTIKRTATQANLDDSVIHWSLNLQNSESCNIRR